MNSRITGFCKPLFIDNGRYLAQLTFACRLPPWFTKQITESDYFRVEYVNLPEIFALMNIAKRYRGHFRLLVYRLNFDQLSGSIISVFLEVTAGIGDLKFYFSIRRSARTL